MDHLSQLTALFNAALEHCPPQTKAILLSLSQPHLSALEQGLTEKPAEEPEK